MNDRRQTMYGMIVGALVGLSTVLILEWPLPSGMWNGGTPGSAIVDVAALAPADPGTAIADPPSAGIPAGSPIATSTPTPSDGPDAATPDPNPPAGTPEPTPRSGGANPPPEPVASPKPAVNPTPSPASSAPPARTPVPAIRPAPTPIATPEATPVATPVAAPSPTPDVTPVPIATPQATPVPTPTPPPILICLPIVGCI